MRDSEYRYLRQRSRIEFNLIDHNVTLRKMLNNELEEIINFPQSSISKIQEFQLRRISEIVDYAYQNIPLYKEKYGISLDDDQYKYLKFSETEREDLKQYK